MNTVSVSIVTLLDIHRNPEALGPAKVPASPTLLNPDQLLTRAPKSFRRSLLTSVGSWISSGTGVATAVDDIFTNRS